MRGRSRSAFTGFGLVVLSVGAHGGIGAQTTEYTEVDECTERRWLPVLVPRVEHAAAYDQQRRTTVVYGGQTTFSLDSGAELGDTWEWDGSRLSRVASSGPIARAEHTMVFDVGAGKSITFGGVNYSVDPLADLWSWNGTRWTDISEVGPAPRYWHAMAFDSARGATVLFGGVELFGFEPEETWEWDGVSWSRAAEDGPPPRFSPSMEYHAALGATVMFGGSICDPWCGPLADTWLWDGNEWTELAVAGPPARARHAMAYDAAREVIVLFGGDGADYLGDTWEFDGAQWNERGVEGPSPRSSHTLTYDALRGRTVLHGGYGDELQLADTWEWDGSTWEAVAGASPPPRLRPGFVFDDVRGKAVLYGGEGQFGVSFEDTWEWDGRSWSKVASGGPSVREEMALAFDSERGRVVLFGGLFGEFGSNYHGDTWEWDGSTWTEVATEGPPGRAWAEMAYDRRRQRTVLFGGAGSSSSRDTWEWDGSVWTHVASEGPEPRTGHAMAYDERLGVTVLFGGGSTSETWHWDGTSWTLMADTGPSARNRHALAYDAEMGRVVLFGGQSSCCVYDDDTWSWDGTTWTPLTSSGPRPRAEHRMVYDSERAALLLYGGDLLYSGTALAGDLWQYARPALPLELQATSSDRLEWNAAPRPAAYDVVRGELGELRASGGDFAAAAIECLASATTEAWLDDSQQPPVSSGPFGSGWFYLVRGTFVDEVGTWDVPCSSQAVGRDASIDLAPASCPSD